MNEIVLTLGGVSFRDMEVPEKICFGGKQRVSVQNLIGGGRIISALGLDDGIIQFSGIFTGADATLRAQELDAARALGAVLPLIWGGFYYLVVIEAFTAEYRKSTFIPFSINCLVATDPLAAAANAVAPLASLVEGDIAAATSLSGQAGVSLQGISATSLVGFAAVQGALGVGVDAAGGAIAGAANALNGAPTPELGVAALSNAQGAAGQLAGGFRMQGFINRVAKNLGISMP